MELGKRRYIRELKLLLPIYGKERKRVVKQIAEEIEHDCDIERDVVVTYEMLCEWHGKPRVVIKNYLENLDAEQLMPHIHMAVVRNHILMTVVLVVLGVFLFLNISYWNGWKHAQGGVWIDYVDFIE